MSFTSKTLGLARAAVTAAGRLVDGVIRVLTAAWAAAWTSLVAGLTAAVDHLIGATLDGQWPARNRIENDPQLRAVLANAARTLEHLAARTATEASTAARSAAQEAAARQAEIIASQLPGSHDAARLLGRARFQGQAVLAIGRRSAQRITALSKPMSADADRAMRRELIRGVRLGRNPRKAADEMVKRVEGAFNGGLTRALVIARTEILDAYREAAAAVDDASTDVLDGWVWLAKLDDGRACVACWAMHGTEHPLSEPGPLGHPQCRCSRAPKTKSWADLGFDLPEPDDVIPNGETLFKALPHDQQVAVMGAERVAMLNNGDIAWRDLTRRRKTSGWRDSFVVVPIKDLARAS